MASRSRGLQHFIENSPLIRQVKDLVEKNEQYKEIISVLNHKAFYLTSVNVELTEKAEEGSRDYDNLEEKYMDLVGDYEELKNDYRRLQLEHEAHIVENEENEKGLKKEIRLLKQALNTVRRHLSPDR